MSDSKKSEKHHSKKKSTKKVMGSSATIREVVEKVQIDIESKKLGKRIRKLQQSLKTKEKAKIVEAARDLVDYYRDHPGVIPYEKVKALDKALDNEQ